MKKLVFFLFIFLISCEKFFDFTRPEVRFISPEDGEEVYLSFEIEIEASDNNLELVELYINDKKFKTYEVEKTYERIKDILELSFGFYKLSAKAYDKGGNWNKSEITISVKEFIPPSLYQPQNGEIITDNTPYFDWSDVDGAVKYWLQVDNNSNFSSPEINDSSITSSNYTATSPFPDGTYYWRVKARNSAGLWGNWSSIWNFFIWTTGQEVQIDYYINDVYKGTATDTAYNYESELKYLGICSGDYITIFDAIKVFTLEGTTIWSDDFETYPVGSWPIYWSQSGNASAPGNEVTDSYYYSGNKAFQLKGEFGGCWEALAYREIVDNIPLIIEFAVLPTGIGSDGCHHHNGALGLWTYPEWWEPGRGLIWFNVLDMHILGHNNIDLGTFSFGQWYKVTIIYHR